VGIASGRSSQWGAVVLGVCLCAPVHAGSYLRSAGEFSYSSSLGYSWATRQWDEQRDLQSTSCRREYNYNSHYFEYGVSYYHTLFGGALLANAHCDAESHTGFGDLRLGVRGRTDRYRNHRAWELIATLPTERGDTSPRLDCGAHGLAGKYARKDEVAPHLSLSSGAGLQLWEGPLVHEASAGVGLSGPLAGVFRLRWTVDLDARAPLEGGGAAGSDIADCGTNGKLLKAGVRLGTTLRKGTWVDCGYTSAVWGEDATLSQGFSCGVSRTWE
jgi:hypothetical protein